jgi:hypothetical protein
MQQFKFTPLYKLWIRLNSCGIKNLWCSNFRQKLEMNGVKVDHITLLMGYEDSFSKSSVGKFQTMPRMLQTMRVPPSSLNNRIPILTNFASRGCVAFLFFPSVRQ